MEKNIKKIMLTATELQEKVADMGAQISADYEGKEILLVGILKGSVVFMADLMRHIQVPVKIDFMSVSSYGNSTETDGEITIRKDLDNDVRGKHVLIVEDIIDTGVTLESLIRLLTERGAASIEIATILSKPSRRVKHVDVRYIGFIIPDEFVVGYGLDFAEAYRELPYIGVLHPECYESKL